MNRYTPGPWTMESDSDGKAAAIRCEPDANDAGTTICEMVSSRGIAETVANATLIASAPELARALEAAKVALSTIEIHLLRAYDRAYPDDIARSINLALAETRSARDEAAAVLVNAVGIG